jgi:predicted oxidoreductase
MSWDKAPILKEDVTKAIELVHTACEWGITLFDHADVYAFGKAEAVFGEVLKQDPGLRDRIVIQSKCGQCLSEGGFDNPLRVDLSYEHIVRSVEGSLKRLGTDRLDILLLHAPDTLVEPELVARAFEDLHGLGKVRYFGVSNHDAAQVALLRRSIRQPIVVNQIRLSLAHPELLAEGLQFTLAMAKNRGLSTRQETSGPMRTGTIDYCRMNDIQVQAWSPLRDIMNPSIGAGTQPATAAQLASELAKQKNTTPAVIALAWLLRHPAGIVPIIGARDPRHLIENCAADSLVLSRNEWYDLFTTPT